MFSEGTLKIVFRRFFWMLTLSTFLLMTTGCTTSRWVSVNEELERDGSGLPKESGQSIAAYQLTDAIEKDFKGNVKLAAQDSLYFWIKESTEAHVVSGSYVPRTVDWTLGPRFALGEVKALKVQMGSPEKTVPLVVGITIAIAGVVAAAISMSDCCKFGPIFGEQ